MNEEYIYVKTNDVQKDMYEFVKQFGDEISSVTYVGNTIKLKNEVIYRFVYTTIGIRKYYTYAEIYNHHLKFQSKKLQKENQQLKEQLQEEQEAYDRMFSLWNNRKFIRKFNKEFDKEDKIKNPNRDYACIMPDAEEVYKRYYELKQQLQQKEDIINKTKECVEELCDETDDTTCYDITKNRKKILLEILDNKGE